MTSKSLIPLEAEFEALKDSSSTSCSKKAPEPCDWYIAQTGGQQYGKLDDFIRKHNLRVEVYAPMLTYYGRGRRTRQKVLKQKPAFPGYVYARGDDCVNLHLTEYNRFNILTWEDEYRTAPGAEIERLKKWAYEHNKNVIHLRNVPNVPKGTITEIEIGPFEGWEGMVIGQIGFDLQLTLRNGIKTWCHIYSTGLQAELQGL